MSRPRTTPPFFVRSTSPCEYGEVWFRGHYGASRVVGFGDHDYVLSAGSSDTVEFYETPIGVAVLTTNRRLAYCGVGLLDPEHHDLMHDPETGQTLIRERSVVFWQHTEPGQIGPKDTLDYADGTLVRRVLENAFG